MGPPPCRAVDRRTPSTSTELRGTTRRLRTFPGHLPESITVVNKIESDPVGESAGAVVAEQELDSPPRPTGASVVEDETDAVEVSGDVTGVLLVGGASRRFGSAKALALLGGRTLAERVWETLGTACSKRVAIGKASDTLGLPFAVVDDGIDVRASIAGVIGGLRYASTDVCVFVPVDCPMVTVEAIHLLASRCRDASVTQAGPLPGAYRRSCLPLFERRLALGKLDLRGALPELNVAYVSVPDEVTTNINSPADLRAAKALFVRPT